MARSYDPPKLARNVPSEGTKTIMRWQPTRAIAWQEPHGGSPPPSLVLSFYHALWPPPVVQSFSETPSLHHASVDVHGATGCVSRLRTSGLVARASACDCRPSYHADRGSLLGHALNLLPRSDIGSHRAGGDGLAGWSRGRR